MSEKRPFSHIAFEYSYAKSDFERALREAGIEFERLGWDDYDNSLEVYGVDNNARLNEACQRIIFDAGFTLCFVNHKDKWETHYSWKRGEFKLSEGSRIRYGHKMEPEQNFHEVEKFPEGWPEDWRESGYIRIVGHD